MDPDSPKRRKFKLNARNQSVHAEPTTAAMRGQLDARKDATVSKAHQRIDNDHLGESINDEAERSVFDEPTYSKELGGNIPENALTYKRFLEEKLETISPIESWLFTGVLVLCSGVFAVVGSFMSNFANMGLSSSVEFVAIAVFAPVIEEVMKTALLLWGVEQKPYWFRSPTQLMIVGACSGLMFAAIENLLYFNVYIEDPRIGIILWRWTVCVGLHTTTTMIATIGLVKIWRRVMQTGKFARAEIGARYLFYAILLHAIYNGSLYLLGFLIAF